MNREIELKIKLYLFIGNVLIKISKIFTSGAEKIIAKNEKLFKELLK